MSINNYATLAIVVTGCLCLLLVVAAPIFGARVPGEIQTYVFSLVLSAASVFIYSKGSSAGEQKTLNALATLSATNAPDERAKAEAALRLLTARSGAFPKMKAESQGVQ